ncbi:hypothetical protein AGMMS49949_09690 [Alphaproteobacteria bacterium]|nr:hypothetical protein AGMMS49949_09690 [Alphaproteobacteria bacterium]
MLSAMQLPVRETLTEISDNCASAECRTLAQELLKELSAQ